MLFRVLLQVGTFKTETAGLLLVEYNKKFTVLPELKIVRKKHIGTDLCQLLRYRFVREDLQS